MIALPLDSGLKQRLASRSTRVELNPRTDGNPVTDTSPLEALERAVLATRANREQLEETLSALPRWRFRRRRKLERSVRRRQVREQDLQEALNHGAPQPTSNVTA